jgi:hypothetical protein
MPFKHKMLKTTPDEWKATIKERFGYKEEAFEQDKKLGVIAEIGTLLENKSFLLSTGLKGLESKLKSRFSGKLPDLAKLQNSTKELTNLVNKVSPGGKNLGVTEKLASFTKEFKALRENDAKHFHKFASLLDGVLAEEEQSAGFAGPVPTLGGIFTVEDFGKVLGQGLHFKDPGVSPDHGDFSHRIQWWLVYNFIELPQGLTWPEVFASLPTYKFTTGRELDMWAFVFDYLPSEMKVLNRKAGEWTRPEEVNHNIMDSQGNCPLLRAILTARYNKRLLMSKAFSLNDKLWSTAYPEMKKNAKGFEVYKKDQLEIALALVPKGGG